MSEVRRCLSPSLARRLILMCQRLAGPRPPVTAETLLDLIRELGCLQLDPLNVVARSHLLVLWSRLGKYDPALLDRLLWQEHRLFEYWAHAASIVLTEDYQLYQHRMQALSPGDEIPWPPRAHQWIEQNAALRDHILISLGERGPLRARDFTDLAVVPWESSGWTAGRNVSRMLDFLWAQGQITVAGRQGLEKLWDLSAHVLPDWTPRTPLSRYERDSRAVQRALRALGIATARDIPQYFTRGHYPELARVLADLEEAGQIERVVLEGKGASGPWFVHRENLPRLAALEAGYWEPRTTLLSPFDNLIIDRRRTALLFDFMYQSEIYLPRVKRRYGYYVLPILHGDSLIGRIDPALDRAHAQLHIHAVHFEASVSVTPEIVRAVTGAIEELGVFLGARTIHYTRPLAPEEGDHVVPLC